MMSGSYWVISWRRRCFRYSHCKCSLFVRLKCPWSGLRPANLRSEYKTYIHTHRFKTWLGYTHTTSATEIRDSHLSYPHTYMNTIHISAFWFKFLSNKMDTNPSARMLNCWILIIVGRIVQCGENAASPSDPGNGRKDLFFGRTCIVSMPSLLLQEIDESNLFFTIRKREFWLWEAHLDIQLRRE